MYSTHSPCLICAKMIVNAKIEKVVVHQNYPDKESSRLFEDAEIELVKMGELELKINTFG